MSDPDLVQEIVANILTAIERIERRFADIDSPDDFIRRPRAGRYQA